MVETKGLVIIGYFVWWAIRDVKLAKSVFIDLLKSIGFDWDFPTSDAALRRTSFLKAVRKTKQRNKKNFLIRKIEKKKDCYVFGLVDESINQKELDLTYHHTATMKFNPETGELSTNFSHRAFDEIKSLYNEYQDMMNSDDVRDVLLKLISKFHKVGLRQRGGIYFLPKKYEAEVEKLEKLLEALPGDCFFSVAPQYDSEKSKVAIYKAFVEGLKAKIQTFREEINNPSGKTRDSTWNTRLDQFAEIKQEIEFYRDAMSFQVDDLSTDLDALRNDVTKQLMKSE